MLWQNKVGPYNNPTETYNFHALPFCKRYPDRKPEHSWGGLGEVLEGNELINRCARAASCHMACMASMGEAEASLMPLACSPAQHKFEHGMLASVSHCA